MGTFLQWGHFCTGDIFAGVIFAGDIIAGDNSAGTFLWGHFVGIPLNPIINHQNIPFHFESSFHPFLTIQLQHATVFEIMFWKMFLI